MRLQLLANQLNLQKKVTTEVHSDIQVGVINLNSPKDLNILSKAMRLEIIEALNQMLLNPSVKCVIIQSSLEKAYCAGADINELATLTYEKQLDKDIMCDFQQAFKLFSKPLIMGVNGIAFGGGFEMALFGDIIIASEDAKFGLPEINLGIFPGLNGTQKLSKFNRGLAMKHIMTGDPFSVTMAKEAGIVTEITKKAELKQECLKLATKIASKSMYTLKTVKNLINLSEDLPMSQGLQIDKTLFSSLLNTKAPKEGMTAFSQKRIPNFKDI